MADFLRAISLILCTVLVSCIVEVSRRGFDLADGGQRPASQRVARLPRHKRPDQLRRVRHRVHRSTGQDDFDLLFKVTSSYKKYRS